MCDALMRIMEEVAQEQIHEMLTYGNKELFERLKSKGIIDDKLAKVLEEKIECNFEYILSAIKNICESLNCPSEQAMDILKIPEDKREQFREML